MALKIEFKYGSCYRVIYSGDSNSCNSNLSSMWIIIHKCESIVWFIPCSYPIPITHKLTSWWWYGHICCKPCSVKHIHRQKKSVVTSTFLTVEQKFTLVKLRLPRYPISVDVCNFHFSGFVFHQTGNRVPVWWKRDFLLRLYRSSVHPDVTTIWLIIGNS